MVVGVFILASAVESPVHGEYAPLWLQIVGLPITLLLFAQFFVATSVVGDARRALGKYLVGDCISTWICLFGYPFFGVFFIQRTVASVLAAFDAKGQAPQGGAIAGPLPSNNRWRGP